MESYQTPKARTGSLLKQFRVRFPEREAQLGSTAWRYCAAGSEGRGLLLLGSAASFGDSSYHLIERFRWSRRVVSPTYPGLGSMGAVADGLVRLMDHEKLETADVFGDALGAGVAQVLLRRYPDRIDRVALASFGRRSARHVVLARLQLALMRWLPEAAHRALLQGRLRRMRSALSAASRVESDALICDLVERSSKARVMEHLALLADLFARSRQYRLDEPFDGRGRVLLLLAGDDPGFTARERARLVDAWPGAEVHAFLSGGPLLGLTRRGEFDRVLDRFFDGPRAAAPAGFS